MANTLIYRDVWAKRAQELFLRGDAVTGLPYRVRGDDDYIEMKRRLYDEEDRRFRNIQNFLGVTIALCAVYILAVSTL